MASDYALLLVPNAKSQKPCDIKIERRHVSKVPGPRSEELAWDTTLDPDKYEDNVTLAADLAKFINQGRRYEAARASVVSNLGDAADIILDLKGGVPGISESSRYGLYEVALNRLHAIGQAFGINL